MEHTRALFGSSAAHTGSDHGSPEEAAKRAHYLNGDCEHLPNLTRDENGDWWTCPKHGGAITQDCACGGLHDVHPKAAGRRPVTDPELRTALAAWLTEHAELSELSPKRAADVALDAVLALAPFTLGRQR